MRMVRGFEVVGICAVMVATVIGAASGGANLSGTAWLSWSGTWHSPDSDLETFPSGTQYLYVQLGNLIEIAGCEFELRWYPPGSPFSGCYEFAAGAHPSGSGTNCTWLMRGGQVEGVNMVDDRSWLIAFAGDEYNRVCSSGNVARALFDFSFCTGNTPGAFCLDYVKVTDSGAELDRLMIVGDATTLGGVSAQDYPCTITTQSTTWGTIKNLYH